jgi:serine/threonine protein kinase
VKETSLNLNTMIDRTRTIARVHHPSVACVYDLGEYEGYPYLLVEGLSGIPLSESCKCSPMAEDVALKLLIPIAEGLCEIWRLGLVHRIVTPKFIYMPATGKLRIDIPVLGGQWKDPHFRQVLLPMMAPYAAPEDIACEKCIDARSDMFSFGATLFHVLTGRTPFEAKSHEEMLEAVRSHEPIDPKEVRPGLNETLRGLMLKLLRKNQNERFNSPEAFMRALHTAEDLTTRRTIVGAGQQTVMVPKPGPKAPEPEAGQVVGNCRLDRKLGAGAFGLVFLARHRMLEIDLAVKLLPQSVLERDPHYIGYFLREARTAARIRHPNVISIYEAGEQNGQYYLIMEYAPGGNVYERMQKNGGRMPPDQVLRVLHDTARGLAAAAEIGVIHRDIKPDNLMFGSAGEIKIADLGLAKRQPKNAQDVRASLRQDQLTRKGSDHEMVGTPAYMAPEMAMKPSEVDARADLYSLGITAYHMLTGTLPFSGKTAIETIMKQIQEVPRPIRELDQNIPEPLAKLVMRLIEKEPEKRYESASVLVQEIEALQGLKAKTGIFSKIFG